MAENLIQSSHDRGLAIVTGGRRGIGSAIAVTLADAGFDLAVIDTIEDEAACRTMERVRASRPGSIFRTMDIAQIDDHAAVLDEISNRFPVITCLVNNAGVQMNPRCDILDVAPDQFDSLMNVNLRGTFFLTQAFARVVSRDDGRYRSVINISSVNAVTVSTEKSVYCISKAGIAMASALFAVRYAEMGIAVFDVRPGMTRTEMTRPVWGTFESAARNGVSPIRRIGEAEDVAQTVRTLAEGRLPYNTGDVIHVGGGIQIPQLLKRGEWQ